MIAMIRRVFRAILIRTFPSKMGYAIRPMGQAYFESKHIIKNAKAAGLSVGEFLEMSNVGKVGVRKDEIILKLKDASVLTPCNSIVEIGAGTGMYLEKFIEICKPDKYEVYETSVGWVKYLREKYSSVIPFFILHKADGFSLNTTQSKSADIIAAHGVFVYLPVVITVSYLQEAARVCKVGGYIVFDCFTDRIFTLSEIIRFREINPEYDFPVILKEEIINEFCTQYSLEILTRFDVNYHLSKSTYFILRKIE